VVIDGGGRVQQALRESLEQLEAVEADSAGLGDTDVRDLTGEDVFRGFLRPEPRFVPSGRHGLDPAANQLVADAIARFVKAARAAAKREG
jgi:hypothetical protein